MVVGVNTGVPHGNHNKMTGHFVNIVGRGIEWNGISFGNFYMFYDNALSPPIGNNTSVNRFRREDFMENGSLVTKMFYMNSDYRKRYFITEIRRNK